MTSIYKCADNGEMIVVTDCLDLKTYLGELGTAMLAAIKAQEGDEEFTVDGIIASAFPIAFKICGYKTDNVHEVRTLYCGYASPMGSDCRKISDSKREA